jgi:DNA polymerase/3'-5' exonuclease PolX
MPDFVFRIDLFYTEDPKEWIPFLVGKTGNKDNNTRLRFSANEKGWMLNDYGLFKRRKNERTKKWESTGQRVIPKGFETEEELFEILDVPYLTPKQRG